MFAIALLANALAAPITLDVDASKARQYLLQVEEHIPVSGRTAQLTLPKWIPGEHQPSGTINHVFGFHAYVKGKEIPWRRDPIELFTINVDLPDGTDELQIKFKVASSPGDNLTAHLGRIKWNRLVFLPAGRIDSIPVKASLTAPAGWVIQSAMHGYPKGDRRDFETVSAEKLVDSPAQIGEFGKSFEVASGYWFDVLVDDPKQLELRPEILTAFKNLVVQSQALTGAKHFKEYHWLSTFSSQGASEGLEHHECSEDGESPDALKPENGYTLGELMCHEMFHSWNGKYRRPAGLVTKTFTEPQQTELLWVYEGLTQYYGVVLACRAGFITPETTRDHIADTIYNLITPGRKWRPLADTAVAASILRSGSSWLDRRSQSYYNEGLAVWLEADAIIRSKTRS
ncbi:MAG: M61 family peptidase, partial [bacterium]